MISIKTTKNAFADDIRALMAKYSVMAPSYVDGKLDYVWITDPTQIAFVDELPYKSPKEAVFPRVEKILTITGDSASDDSEIRPMLLLGAKPCDIEALKVLDEVFTGEKSRYPDPYYKRRRDALLLFGMSCSEKKRGCFCDERGIDMTFSPVSDAFITVDGNTLIIDVNDSCPQSVLDLISGERTEKETPPGFGEKDPVLRIEAEESDIFGTMPWEEYIEGCLGCGTCTYLCPTCHCFEFRDTDVNGVVSRYRCWDSCMYPKFTLHASGHNPRSSKAERFRQRVMHKYVYVPKNFGLTACTGCGRCIRACPGGVSIRRAVEDIKIRLGKQAAGKGRPQ